VFSANEKGEITHSFDFTNTTELYALPETGGVGKEVYLFGGMCVFICTLFLLVYKIKSDRRRKYKN
jgi:LPXTG-motif cell wall-anchored protein